MAQDWVTWFNVIKHGSRLGNMAQGWVTWFNVG